MVCFSCALFPGHKGGRHSSAACSTQDVWLYLVVLISCCASHSTLFQLPTTDDDDAWWWRRRNHQLLSLPPNEPDQFSFFLPTQPPTHKRLSQHQARRHSLPLNAPGRPGAGTRVPVARFYVSAPSTSRASGLLSSSAASHALITTAYTQPTTKTTPSPHPTPSTHKHRQRLRLRLSHPRCQPPKLAAGHPNTSTSVALGSRSTPSRHSS